MLFRYGKFTVENLIHLVLDSTHDLQPTLWYICEFNSWRNSENWLVTRLKSSPSSSSSLERDDATAKKDLSLLQEKQEKDLAQREKTIAQKEKNLAQKETLLQQKLLRAELREREALEFEQEAKIKLEEVDEKEQELEAEKEKLALKKNKNKGRFSTSSIPTHHDTENSDDDENPTTTNENNDNNQWLLRFSNLQKRLEVAYREIENLRRPVSPAGTTTNITTATTAAAAATANGDNDNNNDNGDNDNNNNDNTDNDGYDNENENSSSIITSLQHELKLTKENAQKQTEENILLRKKMNQLKNIASEERNVSSLRRNVSSLRRRGIRDNLVDEEAFSVGNRWAPLNFRVERRLGSATTGRRRGSRRRRSGGEEEEIVGMIEMQKEFRFLGRLR